MKPLFLFLISLATVHAATVDIPNIPYQFEYDSRAWSLLPESTKTKGLWIFSNPKRHLEGRLMCFDSGTVKELAAIDHAEAMKAEYDKLDDIKLSNGLKIVTFSSSKTKRMKWMFYLVEDRYTLYVTIDGDIGDIITHESTFQPFLSGLKKK